ncbi:hypothetical protein CNEO4_1460061 [Clostridium neonatale]|uniref:Uncharacterized protein n=1 Tax=Clostridium neonatale TaxID=137838 RepID=A0AA86JR01_9CLOT|nr:hypothetical protein CNEO_240029 [Clostridium neonatale]CAG9707093.1 hypothetical protein CNEO_1270024 [Clostridium neonatale]CAG9708508.1 hypothetical protein CNEO_43654 [Clostridium neonatale]CAI3193240.1 hypothetical protein CNEO2_140014 [Clostridium neonatale]CAI3196027.1 hypothetical protein CNEO2_140113 [Clostridium neonatale]
MKTLVIIFSNRKLNNKISFDFDNFKGKEIGKMYGILRN